MAKAEVSLSGDSTLFKELITGRILDPRRMKPGDRFRTDISTKVYEVLEVKSAKSIKKTKIEAFIFSNTPLFHVERLNKTTGTSELLPVEAVCGSNLAIPSVKKILLHKAKKEGEEDRVEVIKGLKWVPEHECFTLGRRFDRVA